MMYQRAKSHEDCNEKGSQKPPVQGEVNSLRVSDDCYIEGLNGLGRGTRMSDKVEQTFVQFPSPNRLTVSNYSPQLCETQENNSALSERTYKKYLDEIYPETDDLKTIYYSEDFRHDNSVFPETFAGTNENEVMNTCYLSNCELEDQIDNTGYLERFRCEETTEVSRRSDIEYQQERGEQGTQIQDKQNSISAMPCCSFRNSQHQSFDYQMKAGEPSTFGHPRTYNEAHRSIMNENEASGEPERMLENTRSLLYTTDQAQPLQGVQGNCINTCVIRDKMTTLKSPPIPQDRLTTNQEGCHTKETKVIDELSHPCSSQFISDEDFYGKITPQDTSPITDRSVPSQGSHKDSASMIISHSNDNEHKTINSPDLDRRKVISPDNTAVNQRRLCTRCKDNLVKSSPSKSETTMTFALMDDALDSIEELLDIRDNINIKTDQLTGYFVTNMDLAFKESLRNLNVCNEECKSPSHYRGTGSWQYSSEDEEHAEGNPSDNSYTRESSPRLDVNHTVVILEPFTIELGQQEEKQKGERERRRPKTEIELGQQEEKQKGERERCRPKTEIELGQQEEKQKGKRERCRPKTEKACTQNVSALKKGYVSSRPDNLSYTIDIKLPTINNRQLNTVRGQNTTHASPALHRFPFIRNTCEESNIEWCSDKGSISSYGKCGSNRPYKILSETKEKTVRNHEQKGSSHITPSKYQHKNRDIKHNLAKAIVPSNQPKRRKTRKKYKSVPPIRRSKLRYKGAPVDLNVIEHRAFWPGFDTVLPLIGRLKITNRSDLT